MMWLLFAVGVIGVAWAFWDAGRQREASIREMRRNLARAKADCDDWCGENYGAHRW